MNKFLYLQQNLLKILILDESYSIQNPLKKSSSTLSKLLILTVFFQLLACKSATITAPIDKIHDDQKCYHNGKLSPAERKNKYPFNTAEKISIISFNADLGQTPITNDTIHRSKTNDFIALSSEQIEDLTDILYNYNYAKKTNLISEQKVGCYYPRHAIVFTDQADKVLTFIEICFECREIKTALQTESTGLFCEGKYDLLKSFFIAIGINYFEEK